MRVWISGRTSAFSSAKWWTKSRKRHIYAHTFLWRFFSKKTEIDYYFQLRHFAAYTMFIALQRYFEWHLINLMRKVCGEAEITSSSLEKKKKETNVGEYM